MLEFIYDKNEDCSPQKDNYLIPVYFDKDVMGQFFFHDKYILHFNSESYINLIINGSFNLLLGKNNNDEFFCWLGDLKQIPEKEQKMFLAHNIESTHNIVSEFADAQLGAQFTKPIKETEMFLLLYKINNLSKDCFSFGPYKLNDTTTLEILQKCSKYKRIIFSGEDDFKRIISELNEEFIETINKDSIKTLLDMKNISYSKNLGGLKLFELYLKNYLNDTNNSVASLFHLYDLRIWADHRDGESKLREIKEKLELTEDSSYNEIYSKLVDLLYKSLTNIFKMLTGVEQ